MTITFFGHSDAIQFDRVLLKNLLTDLIENQNAVLFYVGNNGRFDSMVLSILKELQGFYPHIQYYIVLAYIPVKSGEYDCLNTVYPDGLENVPKRFAICKRNDWMIEQADIVIVYVTRSYGGASQFKILAEKRGKIVINLANLQ